jgi:hypothetical protein
LKDEAETLFDAVISFSIFSILLIGNGSSSDSYRISSSHNRPTSSHHEVIDDGSSTENFASPGDAVYGSQSQNQNQQ